MEGWAENRVLCVESFGQKDSFFSPLFFSFLLLLPDVCATNPAEREKTQFGTLLGILSWSDETPQLVCVCNCVCVYLQAFVQSFKKKKKKKATTTKSERLSARQVHQWESSARSICKECAVLRVMRQKLYTLACVRSPLDEKTNTTATATATHTHTCTHARTHTHTHTHRCARAHTHNADVWPSLRESTNCWLCTVGMTRHHLKQRHGSSAAEFQPAVHLWSTVHQGRLGEGGGGRGRVG